MPKHNVRKSDTDNDKNTDRTTQPQTQIAVQHNRVERGRGAVRRPTRLPRQTDASTGITQQPNTLDRAAEHGIMLRSRTRAMLSRPVAVPCRYAQPLRQGPAGGSRPAGGHGAGCVLQVPKGQPAGVGIRPAGGHNQTTRRQPAGVSTRPADEHRRVNARRGNIRRGPISIYDPMGILGAASLVREPTDEEIERNEEELAVHNYDEEGDN